MRVICPKCRQRFDVAHVAVLQEARRLAAQRRAGNVTEAVEGNKIDPTDARQVAERARAVEKRQRLAPEGTTGARAG